MRLSSEQITSIKSAVSEVFGPETRAWLFGSRVDDTAKGGDIDLYIEAKLADSPTISKTKLLMKLWASIGVQKIDIIVRQPQQMMKGIHKEATERGVQL